MRGWVKRYVLGIRVFIRIGRLSRALGAIHDVKRGIRSPFFGMTKVLVGIEVENSSFHTASGKQNGYFSKL
jgi:hypothetical protein